MREITISDFFYRLRGFAIISVVYAHCLFSDVSMSYAANLIGIIGVPVFLIASGYFFRKQSIKDFITSKFANIVVPWLIWGSVAYFVSLLAGGHIKYIPYLLGFGTWLYYVPLYLFITFLFNCLNSHSFYL